MDLSTLNPAASATATSQTSSAFSQLTDNFDTFLTLLTTQLRNQDPLEPLDTEQFTQQLVQFAGVEQSIQANSNLETLIALQANSQREQSLDLVGRVASIDSNETVFGNDRTDRTTYWRYTVPAAVTGVSLQVIDANDNVIANLEATNNVGSHNVIWNGLNNDGREAPDGTYRLRASGTNSDGSTTALGVQTRDLVSGVQFTQSGSQIILAGQPISPDDIIRVDTDF